MDKNPNNPFVVWTSCILWLISVFEIFWSLLLFFCVGDMLFLTGTDLVNAVVLLSGIIMLPTKMYMLHVIAKGNKIDYKAKLICCRLWICIVWIIIINIIGFILCIQRLYSCQDITLNYIIHSINQYRIVPKHRRFIDKLQWSLGCCGIKSYKDWFIQDWHDEIRDYEWTDPSRKIKSSSTATTEVDSVPFSCCKSGSCVSSYLKELGNYSINTEGCGYVLYRIIMISMTVHFIMFLTVIVLEILLIKHITIKKNETTASLSRFGNKLNIKRIMSVNDNFEVSSASYNSNEEDNEFELPNVKK